MHYKYTIMTRVHRQPHNKQSVKSVIGELRLHYDGYGFVVNDDPQTPDVFIPARHVGYAMHKDIVEVKVSPSRRGLSLEGQVVRVIEHNIKQLVGRFEQQGKHSYVVADDLRVRHRISIPENYKKGARQGQTVIVAILKYPAPRQQMEGKIVEILGLRGDEDVEAEIVVAKHHLPMEFPKKVIEESERLGEQYIKNDKTDRVDLRNKVIFTIDGENAKDFDDAVGIEIGNDGIQKLYVSIADVSCFVSNGSNIDREAYERGTSTYFPHKCIPMLPPTLSENLCSLRPFEDRLTLTAELHFSKAGEVVDSKFYRSIINSKARFTYTEVRKVLVDNDQSVTRKYQHLVRHLKAMEELCQVLRRKRINRGSIDFDLPEPEIVLDMEGSPENIVRAERNIAHRMIEEFMISANEAVATFLTRHGFPCVYRVHDTPESMKMREFEMLIHNLGYKIRLGSKPNSHILASVIAKVEGRPEERLVNTMLLRSMAQAVYSTTNIGHFGLASDCYCHFTSPIRRYPDLVVHRLLLSCLEGKRQPKKSGVGARLREIAEHSSKRERVSLEAEREMHSLYTAMFMYDKIGLKFDGVISHVTKFGFFVELVEFFVEGLVHITTLKNDKYRFDESGRAIVGGRHKNRFCIGDRVKVVVEEVSIERREISFTLVATN